MKRMLFNYSSPEVLLLTEDGFVSPICASNAYGEGLDWGDDEPSDPTSSVRGEGLDWGD